MNKLAYLYGFSLPFTSVLAVNPWLPLPAVVGMFGLIMILVNGFRGFCRFDFVVFFGFVFPVIISSILNYSHIGSRTFLSHLFSYIFVFFIYYLVPREFLRHRWAPLLSGVSSGFLLSISFEYFEFIFANFIGPYWLSYIPRIDVNFYAPTFAGSIIRARSFVEESGHFALYLGVISPIIFIYKDFIFGKWNRRLFFLSVCVALILTFSTSGIGFSIIAAIFSVITLKSSMSKKFLKFITLVIFVLSVYVAIRTFFGVDLSRLVTEKLTTMNGRLQPFVNSLEYFIRSDALHIIFGLGPGYYEYRGLPPTISLPAMITFSSGIFGLFCYFMMFLIAVARVRLFDVRYRPFLMFALVFSFLVYGGISNYWYPWLWFLFSFLSIGPRIAGRHRNYSTAGV
jgi:hypothetical protein